jgi:hypothetical protein
MRIFLKKQAGSRLQPRDKARDRQVEDRNGALDTGDIADFRLRI